MSARAAIAVLCICLCSPAVAAEVYRWVDEQGRTHFSDEPRPGAEQVPVDDPSVVDGPAPPRRSAQPQGRDEAASAPDWQVRIEAPADAATIRDNRGRVQLTVDVRPELRAGHQLVALVDGTPASAGPFDSADIELTGIHRGTHELGVLLRDDRGRTLARSESVTIHIHQNSRLLPNR